MDAGTIRRGIKTMAKRQLFGYMLPCIGVALVGSVITMLLSVILTARMPDVQELLQAEDLSVYWKQLLPVYGLNLAFSILISPLTVGSYAFFMQVSKDEKPPFTSVFSWLGEGQKALKAYGANLWYLLITLKYVLIFLVPAGALFVGSTFLLNGTALGFGLALYLLAFLVFIAAAVLAFAYINAYQPALYMIATDPTLPVISTFAFCGRIMKKRIWEFLLFRLSFLPWEILGAVTIGISVVFVTPYINLSVAGWTRYIKEKAFEEMSREGIPF